MGEMQEKDREGEIRSGEDGYVEEYNDERPRRRGVELSRDKDVAAIRLSFQLPENVYGPLCGDGLLQARTANIC